MVLIVSNSRDFGVDDVVERLQELSVEYIRLDLDLAQDDDLILEPTGPLLIHRLPDGKTRELSSPQAVLYRAPTHLRESSGHRYGPEQLLKRHQWAAFARSLMVFQQATWVNHPMRTYAAENKPLQLAIAASLGFRVPRTAVANTIPGLLRDHAVVAMKALDSFLLRAEGDTDLFFYTKRIHRSALEEEDLRSMPLILQDYIDGKLDVRVTIAGDQCFVAQTEERISGDWRRHKDTAKFVQASLPSDLEAACFTLVAELGLKYGAIDLTLTEKGYEFLEINPTGEWAWLDPVFDGSISRAIAKTLVT